jgi:hypothetical protein
MCCMHLGKSVHGTVLHALGLVRGNDLEVCSVELYICIYMTIYIRGRRACVNMRVVSLDVDRLAHLSM